MYLQSDITSAVRRVQEYLYEIHLHDKIAYFIAPSGIYGKSTQKAVTEFQERKGLPVTGIVDLNTFEALRETAKQYNTQNSLASHLYSNVGYPLHLGSQGADIEVLHALLRSLSEYEKELPPIPRTSYFSKDTERAIRYMQKVFRVKEDGLVNAELFDRLERELESRREFIIK